MNDKLLPLCPTVGLVVVVHPGQHVDLRIRGVEHHGPVPLVDADGIQILALGALDHLVVQTRRIGPLPAGGSVKVDITIREQLVFPLEARPVLRAHEEFADLPEGRIVQAYSLTEIATEKVVALADRARNEPRDLYDLWHLISREGMDLSHLVPAIIAKLAFRNVEATGIQEAIMKKEARLKALWSARLANQMSELPPFDQVFREFRRALRQSDLP